MAIEQRRHADLVHSYLLERNARADPDRPFLRFPDESITWSRSETVRESHTAAAHLRSLGVARGDVVALLGPSDSQYLRYFLGALRLGAVVAPLNHAYRGNILRHVLTIAGTRTLVLSADLVDRLTGLELDDLALEVVCTDPQNIDPPVGWPQNARLHARTDSSSEERLDDPDLHYWDTYAIVFTSGTTGPSKGVLSPYGQIHAVVRDNFLEWVGPDDVLLLDAPVFHISGLLMIYTAVATGAELVVYPKFSGTSFWSRIRRHNVTVSTIVGPEALLQAPEQPDDADNPLRLVLTGRHSPEWKRRFGVERSFTFYSMSEISSPLQLQPEPANMLSVGVPRPGVELRVVDEHDIEVSVGEVGELIVRTDRPWEMNLGYVNNPEATAAAWRNGWFHTGDAFRVDPDSGEYLLIDRLKDCVRRRGENISSFEVESEIIAHPSIEACAVIAVPGDIEGDEEIKAVVVPVAGCVIDPVELVAFLEPMLPSFMLPRYVEVTDALPRTESMKVRKVSLRAEGVNARTWVRTAHALASSTLMNERES